MIRDDDRLPPPPPAPIPNNAEEDVPPAPESNGDPNATTEVDDPDAAHKRKVDLSKLKFAMWFASATTAGAVLLALAEYFTPQFAEVSNGKLDTVSDAMKLLATTSLGYIFGRSARANDC